MYCICLWIKKFELYFSDQLTFSNIHGRTSHLPLLCARETLSSSKSRIFLYNAHLALFVQRMTQLWLHKLSFNKLTLKLALEVRALQCHLQTRQHAESLRTGKECEREELCFRRGSPLACEVMGIACSNPPPCWLLPFAYWYCY